MRHLILFLLFCFVLGCGSNVTITGKVSFPDGSPLDRGEVRFQNDHFVAAGKIGSDGGYRLGSLKKDDGIPVGVYQVSIAGAAETFVPPPGKGLEDTPAPKFLIDMKFADPKSSGLICEVKGKQRFDITVTKP